MSYIALLFVVLVVAVFSVCATSQATVGNVDSGSYVQYPEGSVQARSGGWPGSRPPPIYVPDPYSGVSYPPAKQGWGKDPTPVYVSNPPAVIYSPENKQGWGK